MEFCEDCGSRMIRTAEGFQCPKCGKTVRVKATRQTNETRGTKQPDYVFVAVSHDDPARINRECPKCRNKQAFHWFSGISGEHAGVARERTVEHFKCTKCSHSWTETS